MTTVRMAEGYQPDFDIDLRYGADGERLVAAFLQGLLDGTVEVKNDGKAVDTARVYIEGECRRRDGWQPSGIMASKASYYALVIGEAVVIGIPTAMLQACYHKALAPALHMAREEKDGSHPTRGVAIPVGYLFTLLLAELRRSRAA
jgi:hypothetical protein